VVVAGGGVDEAQLASETLDLIEALGFPELASNAVVAIQSASQTPVDVTEVARHFASRVRAVVKIPRDAHLAEGSRLDLARLSKSTRLACLELAAQVVDGLARPRTN
jgi:MinD-like ATPase involved in chromosome partitioning or flagellar assembly